MTSAGTRRRKDPLTGLANRAHFLEQLGRRIIEYRYLNRIFISPFSYGFRWVQNGERQTRSCGCSFHFPRQYAGAIIGGVIAKRMYRGRVSPSLSAPTWQLALRLGFVSAVFDNIPLTALAIYQGDATEVCWPIKSGMVACLFGLVPQQEWRSATPS